MISDKTIIECASDAVSYAQQLNVIFNRCTPNGAYGDSEDYAIHKIGKPIAVNNPDNWISTPSASIYIKDLFKQVNNLAQQEKSDQQEKPGVRIVAVGLLQRAFELMEGLSRQEKSPESVAGSIVSSAKSVLPELRRALDKMLEPEVS